VLLQQTHQLLGERDLEAGGVVVAGAAQRRDGVVDEGPVLLRYAGDGELEQPGPLLELQLDVLTRGVLELDAVLPRRDRVGPRLDDEGPPALRVEGDVGRPLRQAVVDLGHRHARTPAPVGAAQHDARPDQVMALAEDGGADGQRLAGDGAGRPAAATDLRTYVSYGDSPDHTTEPTRPTCTG
jgi:hypothetical protein